MYPAAQIYACILQRKSLVILGVFVANPSRFRILDPPAMTPRASPQRSGFPCLRGRPQHLHRDFRAIDLPQETEEDVHPFSRADRPLKHTLQPGEWTAVNHNFIAGAEGMARQSACSLNLHHLFVDEGDSGFGHDSRTAVKAQDTTQTRNPLQIIDSEGRQVTLNEQICREQRSRRTTPYARQQREKRGNPPRPQRLGHADFGVRFGV